MDIIAKQAAVNESKRYTDEKVRGLSAGDPSAMGFATEEFVHEAIAPTWTWRNATYYGYYLNRSD